MRQEYQCKLSRTTSESSAFGKCQSWQEVRKADIGAKLAGCAAIEESLARHIYPLLIAQRRHEPQSYIIKKGPTFSGRKLFALRVQPSLKKLNF